MISISKLSKRFSRLEVLKDISLTIDEPGIFAVLGPNGSGKTTLMKCILGLTIPTQGEIMVNGSYVLGESIYRQDIGYLPQIATFPENLKVRELISLISSLRQEESREKELIEFFKLHEYLDSRLGNLSGGTKQKVNVVTTFMFDNPIYILDEPTAGLDPVSLINLKKLISEEREKGKMILITTHIVNLVEEIADTIIFILEGRIFFNGSLEDMKAKYEHQQLEKAIARILELKQDE